MIAVDTNLLVYAHRKDSPWHQLALEKLGAVAEGRSPWAIPWPCLHEFVAVVTSPRVFRDPTPLAVAFEQIDAWLEAPKLTLLSEGAGYWPRLRALAEGGQIAGARIAALCLFHGVSELWSADRDFSRFPSLRVRNPLVG